jgi:hypothetical protein
MLPNTAWAASAPTPKSASPSFATPGRDYERQVAPAIAQRSLSVRRRCHAERHVGRHADGKKSRGASGLLSCDVLTSASAPRLACADAAAPESWTRLQPQQG